MVKKDLFELYKGSVFHIKNTAGLVVIIQNGNISHLDNHSLKMFGKNLDTLKSLIEYSGSAYGKQMVREARLIGE